MHTRRRSREFLLQSLYSRALGGADFDRERFIESYFSGAHCIDREDAYIDQIEEIIFAHEQELLGYIAYLAPKFDIETLPTLHILILMIALAEILYAPSSDIPPVVSVNEAVELAKRFSDDGGREFVNGVLSTFLAHRKIGKLDTKESNFRLFSVMIPE